MKTSEQALQQIERTLRKTIEKFPATEEATVMTDIHLRVTQETGELTVYNDDDVEIIVDGSVSPEGAREMAAMGASIFVGGTAGIYRKGMSLEETIPQFRKMIE